MLRLLPVLVAVSCSLPVSLAKKLNFVTAPAPQAEARAAAPPQPPSAARLTRDEAVEKLVRDAEETQTKGIVLEIASLLQDQRIAESPEQLLREVGRLEQDPRHTHITLSNGRVVPREVVLPTQFRQLLTSQIPPRAKQDLMSRVAARLSVPRSQQEARAPKALIPSPIQKTSSDQLIAQANSLVQLPEPVLPASSGYGAAAVAPADSYRGVFSSASSGYNVEPEQETVEEEERTTEAATTTTTTTPPPTTTPPKKPKGEEKKPAGGAASGQNAKPAAAAKPTAGTAKTTEGARPSAGGSAGGAAKGPEENYGYPANFGRAGEDFPIYSPDNIPSTSFSCEGRVKGGLYADVEARCQVYHTCLGGGKVSNLCPNVTMFNQATNSCTYWAGVDCSDEAVENLALLNELLEAEMNFITAGLEVENPLVDLPWRNRDKSK